MTLWNTILEEAQASSAVQRNEETNYLQLGSGLTTSLRVKQLRLPKNRFVYVDTMPEFMRERDGKYILQVTFTNEANSEMLYEKHVNHSLMVSLKSIFDEVGYSQDESNQFYYLKPNVSLEVELFRSNERWASIEISNWRSLE